MKQIARLFAVSCCALCLSCDATETEPEDEWLLGDPLCQQGRDTKGENA